MQEEKKKLRTKSSIFILPMLIGIPYSYFKGFVNCYIGVKTGNKKKDGQRRIYLAFRTDDLCEQYCKLNDDRVIENKSRVQTFQSHNQYVETIVVEEYTLYVFKPLKNFEEDFDRFKYGKYSKFSGKYKNILKKLYPNTKMVRATINPSDEDRRILSEKLDFDFPEGSEIHSIPDELQETFSLSQFLEIEL